MKLRAMMLVTAMLLCGSALSQTLYKCGRTYQDRPCDDGKGTSMGAATSSPGVTSGATDAECVQRGQDSLKIVWAREGGATEERMLAEAATPAQRRLVQEVYRKRGSASQIQSAIATDCIAQKQQIERDAALAAAAAVRRQRADDGSPRGIAPADRGPGEPSGLLAPQPGRSSAWKPKVPRSRSANHRLSVRPTVRKAISCHGIAASSTRVTSSVSSPGLNSRLRSRAR